MAKMTLEYCSLSYLNQWLTHDKKYYEVMNSPSSTLQEKSAALKKAAGFYSVGRSLRTKYDTGEGFARYEPLIDILDKVNSAEYTKENSVEKLLEFETEFSGVYKRNVLSATTKFVWLKVKSPVLIYDENARKALVELNGNVKKSQIKKLDVFYENWHAAYERHETEIKSACRKLSSMSAYTVDPVVATKEYIDSVASQRWFQERVFDNFLWGVGATK